MKKNILFIICFFILASYANANSDLPPLTNADKWFNQPQKGQQTNDLNWKIILWRSDKWKTNDRWRYYPHISSRYYHDCSYYKYVNCEDFRFCRCWQCRDYQYRWEYSN